MPMALFLQLQLSQVRFFSNLLSFSELLNVIISNAQMINLAAAVVRQPYNPKRGGVGLSHRGSQKDYNYQYDDLTCYYFMDDYQDGEIISTRMYEVEYLE